MSYPLPHGTVGHFNARCPWPERRGCLVTVMGITDAQHVYPVNGLGKDDVVVHVSEDPLERPGGPAILPNGLPWSCVTSVDTIDVIGNYREAE